MICCIRYMHVTAGHDVVMRYICLLHWHILTVRSHIMRTGHTLTVECRGLCAEDRAYCRPSVYRVVYSEDPAYFDCTGSCSENLAYFDCTLYRAV